jgi:hypothetical protein
MINLLDLSVDAGVATERSKGFHVVSDECGGCHLSEMNRSLII